MVAWRYEIPLRVVKYFFQHEKRNLVSHGHVISRGNILYLSNVISGQKIIRLPP